MVVIQKEGEGSTKEERMWKWYRKKEMVVIRKEGDCSDTEGREW